MSREYLEVTLIDVGWGDSILVESYQLPDGQADGERQNRRFGLIDSNDEPGRRLTYDFVTRYFKTSGLDLSPKRIFDFVLLSHWHTDHGSGLEHMMRKYGTGWFWYPKANLGEIAKLGSLFDYSIRAKTKISDAHAIDNRPENVFSMNDCQGSFLWPPPLPGPHYLEENHASVVLDLCLGDVHFMLTGDCEAENWPGIIPKLPRKSKIRMFKVPHHGSQNGVFNMKDESTPWLDYLAKRTTKIAMSSHISPHKHPHPRVVQEFEDRGIKPLRTDKQYHLTFRTDGKKVETKWSRF